METKKNFGRFSQAAGVFFSFLNFAEAQTITCHDALNERGLTCPASATIGPDYNIYDEISSMSDTQLIQHCCRVTCEEEMNSRSPQVICTDGVPREEWEHVVPALYGFPSYDFIWEADDTALASMCCQKTCYYEMNKHGLTCDIGRVNEHDGHQPSFFNDPSWIFSVEELKSECCQISCGEYQPQPNCDSGTQLMVDYDLPCRGEHCNSMSDMIKESCCRTTCGAVYEARDFTCPAGKVPNHNHDIGDGYDVSTVTMSELEGECCVDLNCYYAMNEREENCMHGQTRSMGDYHKPYDGFDFIHATSEDLQRECCVNNCFHEMNARSTQCPAGLQLRHEHDFHDPFHTGADWTDIPQVQLEEECCRRTCSAEFEEKGLTCPSGYMEPNEYDMHQPDGGWDGMSNEDIVAGCCQSTCTHLMSSRSLTCPAEYPQRSSMDYHSPCRLDGCDTLSDSFVKEECCQGMPEEKMYGVCADPMKYNQMGELFNRCYVEYLLDSGPATVDCFDFDSHIDSEGGKGYCYRTNGYDDQNECYAALTEKGLDQHGTPYYLTQECGNGLMEWMDGSRSKKEFCEDMRDNDEFQNLGTNCCSDTPTVCEVDSTPSPTNPIDDNVDINPGILLFTKDSPACAFERHPWTKGDHLVTNIAIVPTANGTKMFVIADAHTTGVYARVKMIKPSFNKKDPMMMNDSTRKSYRDAHIDKYFHYCQSPWVRDGNEVAMTMGMVVDKFNEMFPKQMEEQYFEVDLPGLDLTAAHYQRFRVEVSLPVDDPYLGSDIRPTVHGCTKVLKSLH